MSAPARTLKDPGFVPNHSDATGCRCCTARLTRNVVDLDGFPLCQSPLDASELNGAEEFYPLDAFVFERCTPVQFREYVSPEKIFSECAAFSAVIDTMTRNPPSPMSRFLS